MKFIALLCLAIGAASLQCPVFKCETLNKGVCAQVTKDRVVLNDRGCNYDSPCLLNNVWGSYSSVTTMKTIKCEAKDEERQLEEELDAMSYASQFRRRLQIYEPDFLESDNKDTQPDTGEDNQKNEEISPRVAEGDGEVIAPQGGDEPQDVPIENKEDKPEGIELEDKPEGIEIENKPTVEATENEPTEEATENDPKEEATEDKPTEEATENEPKPPVNEKEEDIPIIEEEEEKADENEVKEQPQPDETSDKDKDSVVDNSDIPIISEEEDSLSPDKPETTNSKDDKADANRPIDDPASSDEPKPQEKPTDIPENTSTYTFEEWEVLKNDKLKTMKDSLTPEEYQIEEKKLYDQQADLLEKLKSTNSITSEQEDTLRNEIENYRAQTEAQPNETPKGDTTSSQPTGDTNSPQTADTNPPETSGDTNPPETTVDTNPPETAGDTNPPETTGDTNPPETAGDTNPPETSADTNPPETSGDTNPPETSGDTNPPASVEDTTTPKPVDNTVPESTEEGALSDKPKDENEPKVPLSDDKDAESAGDTKTEPEPVEEEPEEKIDIEDEDAEPDELEEIPPIDIDSDDGEEVVDIDDTPEEITVIVMPNVFTVRNGKAYCKFEKKKNFKSDNELQECESSDDCELEDGSKTQCTCGLDGKAYCQPHMFSSMFERFAESCSDYGYVDKDTYYAWKLIYENYIPINTAPGCAENVFRQLKEAIESAKETNVDEFMQDEGSEVSDEGSEPDTENGVILGLSLILAMLIV